MENKPEYGKQYSLTGSGKSIANGNTWAESEVIKDLAMVDGGLSEDEAERMMEDMGM